MFQSDGACWRRHHAFDESTLKELGYRILESQRQSLDGFVWQSFPDFESNSRQFSSNWTSFIDTSWHWLNSYSMALLLLDYCCWSILVWCCWYRWYCGTGCRFRFVGPRNSRILLLRRFFGGLFALDEQPQAPHEYSVKMWSNWWYSLRRLDPQNALHDSKSLALLMLADFWGYRSTISLVQGFFVGFGRKIWSNEAIPEASWAHFVEYSSWNFQRQKKLKHLVLGLRSFWSLVGSARLRLAVILLLGLCLADCRLLAAWVMVWTDIELQKPVRALAPLIRWTLFQ